MKKAEWLEARRERLLPVPYFHVVFTLPDGLRPLALGNKRVVFDILFRSVAETLNAIAADKKHLGAQLGFTAILHTWGQRLTFHPHLHCVVTGGGLTKDRRRWKESSSPEYLLPVRVLGRLYRGKFLHALSEARRRGELHFDAGTAGLGNPKEWRALVDKLYSQDWLVYAKPPFASAEHVFRYLGRYTHRVAISNHRLLGLVGGKVSFKYRDYRENGVAKVLSLAATEFIRRFLLHVLPHRFVRIRHFGLLASRNVKTKLARARQLLAGSAPVGIACPSKKPMPLHWAERLLQLTGFDIFDCPACETGRLHTTALEMCASNARRPMTLDSS